MGVSILSSDTVGADEDILKDKCSVLLRSDGPVFRTEDRACPELYLCIWYCNVVRVDHRAPHSAPTQEWNDCGNFFAGLI